MSSSEASGIKNKSKSNFSGPENTNTAEDFGDSYLGEGVEAVAVVHKGRWVEEYLVR